MSRGLGWHHAPLDTLDAELRLLAAGADMEHLGNREREIDT